MADATFTTVVARVDQQLTNAIWEDQIRDNLNQLAGAHRNLLTNGGFEVWQRGIGPFTTDAYTADRWLLTENGSTVQVDREASIVDGASAFSAKVAVSGLSGNPTFVQKIEDVIQLRGRTISLSVRARQSSASAFTARISCTGGGGSTTSSTSATTGSYVTYTVTHTVGASDTALEIVFFFAANATFYVDNAMLTIGPDAAPYQPLHPQEDLARCQRYYEVHGSVNGAFPAVVGIASAGGQTGRASITFATVKAGTPTLTKNGTWAVTNTGQPSALGPTQNGYYIDISSSAGGVFSTNPNSSDDTISAEFNP